MSKNADIAPTTRDVCYKRSFYESRRRVFRGPRIITVAGNPEHLWSEQHGIKTRTKRNHSRTNSWRLTIGGNYSRSPTSDWADVNPDHRRIRSSVHTDTLICGFFGPHIDGTIDRRKS